MTGADRSSFQSFHPYLGTPERTEKSISAMLDRIDESDKSSKRDQSSYDRLGDCLTEASRLPKSADEDSGLHAIAKIRKVSARQEEIVCRWLRDSKINFDSKNGRRLSALRLSKNNKERFEALTKAKKRFANEDGQALDTWVLENGCKRSLRMKA